MASEIQITIPIFWGLLVMSYYFLKGIASGIFFLISFGETANIPSIKKMSKLGIWVSFAFSFVLPFILIADLHQPARFWELFVRGHYESPMAWGALILSLYFLLGALTTHFYMRSDFVEYAEKHSGLFSLFFKALALNRMEVTKDNLAFDKKVLKVLFYFNMFIAFSLEMYAGILISINASRPLWSSPVIPLIFMASAISGGAVVLFMVYGIFHYFNGTYEDVAGHEISTLRKIAIGAILAELIFTLMQLLYFKNSNIRGEQQFNLFFSDSASLIEFVLFEIGVAIIIPIILFAIGEHRKDYIVTFIGGVFTLFGSWFYKYNLVIGGQEIARSTGNLSEFEWNGFELGILMSVTFLFAAVLLSVYWYFPWMQKEVNENE